MSTVRSNRDGSIGFLSDIRRINVALTRAKYVLSCCYFKWKNFQPILVRNSTFNLPACCEISVVYQCYHACIMSFFFQDMPLRCVNYANAMHNSKQESHV